MASLKDLRGRINSVKSTRKITSAMKMVAASKLRRAQAAAEAASPYAERMSDMLSRLAANVAGSPGAPRLLVGTGRDQVHLVIAMTADRGLAGAFNSGVGRQARTLVRRLLSEGKQVKILAVGRKGRDYLRREFAGNHVGRPGDGRSQDDRVRCGEGRRRPGVRDVRGPRVRCGDGGVQPLQVGDRADPDRDADHPAADPRARRRRRPGFARAIYEFEPDEETILLRLLPQNLAIQIYRAMLESNAGFYGAQMTSMDNATRNAGDMIQRLTQNYNRTRQANITRELIEIISGAEAL